MQDQVVEHASVAKSTVAAYASAGGAALVGGFTAQEWAALIAAACAIITCIANVWFKHREDQRAEREAGRSSGRQC